MPGDVAPAMHRALLVTLWLGRRGFIGQYAAAYPRRDVIVAALTATACPNASVLAVNLHATEDLPTLLASCGVQLKKMRRHQRYDAEQEIVAAIAGAAGCTPLFWPGAQHKSI